MPNGSFLVAVVVLTALAIGLWAIPAWLVWHPPDAEVRSTGVPRAAWIVLIVAVGPVGAVAYLVAARSPTRGDNLVRRSSGISRIVRAPVPDLFRA